MFGSYKYGADILGYGDTPCVPPGSGIRDGRGYGPYGMGYTMTDPPLPYGPDGKVLPSPDYDFTPGPNGFLGPGREAPLKLAPGVTWVDENGNWGTEKIIPYEVVGGFDISTWQKQMNVLKVVPVGIAQVLVERGKQAIDYAEAIAKVVNTARAAIPFVDQVPGATRRAEVAGKLRWHADNLAKVSPTAWQVYKDFQSDPDAFKKAGAKLAAVYQSGADLKKWVMEAFKEANAIEEGAASLIASWDAMWREIGAAIAGLPDAMQKAIKETAWYLQAGFWVAVGAVALTGVTATVMLVRGGPRSYERFLPRSLR